MKSSTHFFSRLNLKFEKFFEASITKNLFRDNLSRIFGYKFTTIYMYDSGNIWEVPREDKKEG